LNFKFYLLLPIIFTVFATSAFADEQVPGMVASVTGDPYYFSEGGFGITILKFYERPLDPYLIPGETTEQSSMEEILTAYEKATQDLSQEIIVNDQDRAQYFVISFFGGEFKEKHEFTSFSKFEHIEGQKSSNPTIPYYYDSITEGFILESLPSKDKEWFYGSIVSGYINSGKAPEPFDVDIEIVTGDGEVLQTWQYVKCDLVEYTPFLDENLANLKFIGEFVSEIRDKSVFECTGFHVDFESKSSQETNQQIIKSSDFVPSDSDRVKSIQIQFSGGELELEKSYHTFSKFAPVTEAKIPILVPGNPFGETPQFTLESLPIKDKEEYYNFISRYIKPGVEPEPFDVTVDLLTGDGTILQTWSYTKCSATNYVTFFLDNTLIYKFKETMDSEIRDKTNFLCSGLGFKSEPFAEEKKIKVPNQKITAEERAQTFVVHFQGTDIAPAKTITSFTKFSPVTNDDLPILLPNAEFGGNPKFFLESLPSKQNEWFYQLISNYINTGKVPEPFEITVEVIAGDGTILQTWEYKDCEVIKYKPYLADVLIIRKFTQTYESEIRDQTIFDCVGFSLDGNSNSPENPPQKTLDYVDFIPNNDERAQRFVASFFGGELKSSYTLYTFAKFEPLVEQRSPHTPANHKINSLGFSLESLPSKDKEEYYRFLSSYVNPGKEPEPFDVNIDLVTGDGKVIQTWNYVDCDLEKFDSYLQNSLLFLTFNGESAVSEIRDKQFFECVGFHVDFDSQDADYPLEHGIVPDYDDRAVAYIIHASGGELEKTRTTALIQKVNTLENQDFLAESLPNKFLMGGYDFISRYTNPGKSPEVFDLRVDLVTGDGTILYSAAYSNCEATNYATYLNDNIAILKFTPSLKSEIIDQVIFDCVGVDALIMPQKDLSFTLKGNLKIISPLVQREIGISSDEIQCKESFELMIRPPKNVGVCVMETSVSKFEERGWEHVTTPTNMKFSDKIKQIIPTNEERAISFEVHFQGTDIAPPKTLNTFSKFVPITNEDQAILVPDNPLGERSPKFYLESLPSKDKEWLYQLFSRYINPGSIPEEFDVTVDVVAGDGTILQTWDYRDCERTDYQLFLDEGFLFYKYHEKWQSEIKDRSFFTCGGLKLNYS